MDELTLLVKMQINKKYKSVRQFARDINIPMTTIVSALKNGIGGTAYCTVCKICNALDIKLLNGVFPVVYDGQISEIVDNFGQLDEKGRHTVAVVLHMELERSKNESIEQLGQLAAFGGKSAKLEVVSDKQQCIIADAVRKINGDDEA